MKKKALSLLVAIAMLVSVISVPALASTPTFKIDGKVVLPGNDVAPEGNLLVTLEYRSDRGTSNQSDDYTTSALIVLMKGSREASFSLDIPFSNTADKNPRFTLGYFLSTASPYWDKGYYTLSGMQYHKEGQTTFPEGSVSGLVITPLRASNISGYVGLPVYSSTQSAMDVTVTAKTTGASNGTQDDYEAKTKVTLTNGASAYSLKVPTTASSAGYVVMYEVSGTDYENKGWYSSSGTVTNASIATKVDVSGGNRSDIHLQLVKKATPATPNPVTPPQMDMDVNDDGRVNIKDYIMFTRAMGARWKFKDFLDINGDGVVDVKDLKIIKEELKELKKNWNDIEKAIKDSDKTHKLADKKHGKWKK